MPNSIDLISYIAAFLTTASFIPQAIQTIKTRSTESLSLPMYSGFTCGVLLWLIYGIQIGDEAIIVANAITFILSSSILSVKICNTISGND